MLLHDLMGLKVVLERIVIKLLPGQSMQGKLTMTPKAAISKPIFGAFNSGDQDMGTISSHEATAGRDQNSNRGQGQSKKSNQAR